MSIERKPKPSERGGALLAALWLSAALAVIAFTLATTVRGEAERASTDSDGTRAYYLAAAAVRRATLRLLWTRQNPNLASLYPVGPSVVMPFPEGEALVEVIPEAAKLNLNASRPEDLYRLLLALGVEPGRAREIALAIVDRLTPRAVEGASPFVTY
jgi:general secretion pathway protein K